LRELVSDLPERYEHSESVSSLLQELANHTTGVAAIEGSRLVGFLMARVIPSFRGKRTAYCPEWAHAADPDNSCEIYQEMYAAVSADWILDKCCAHLITLFSDDKAAIDAWFWEGFGLLAVDAIRDLSRAEGEATDTDITRAEPANVEALLRLDEALRHHLWSAPTFLGDTSNPDTRRSWENQIRNEEICIQLACQVGKRIAYMKVGPANPSACHIIRDDKTASVTGAFTDPDVRGRGVGTALLNSGVNWARLVGYERCAVDFEPMNVVGSRFWLRHFRPICLSVMRIVDEKVVQA
jgi:GNAT superfamily N-acetyltransferase